MSNVTRHTVRRGNVASKSASRKSRAARADRAVSRAYSQRDVRAILATEV